MNGRKMPAGDFQFLLVEKLSRMLTAVFRALLGTATAGVGTCLHLLVVDSKSLTALGTTSTRFGAELAHFGTHGRSAR